MALITLTELIADGTTIFNETSPGANTHERVGQLFIDMVSMWSQPYQTPKSTIDVGEPPAIIVQSEDIFFSGQYSLVDLPINLEFWTAPPQAAATPIPALTNWVLFSDSPTFFSGGEWRFEGYAAWSALYGDPSGFLGDKAPFMLVERDNVGRRSVAGINMAFILQEL
jgi:hypothetical protein